MSVLKNAILAGINGGYGAGNSLASAVEGLVTNLAGLESFPRAEDTTSKFKCNLKLDPVLPNLKKTLTYRESGCRT